MGVQESRRKDLSTYLIKVLEQELWLKCLRGAYSPSRQMRKTVSAM